MRILKIDLVCSLQHEDVSEDLVGCRSLTHSGFFTIIKSIKPKLVFQAKRLIQRSVCLYKWLMLFSNFFKSIILISFWPIPCYCVKIKPTPEYFQFRKIL